MAIHNSLQLLFVIKNPQCLFALFITQKVHFLASFFKKKIIKFSFSPASHCRLFYFSGVFSVFHIFTICGLFSRPYPFWQVLHFPFFQKFCWKAKKNRVGGKTTRQFFGFIRVLLSAGFLQGYQKLSFALATAL